MRTDLEFDKSVEVVLQSTLVAKSCFVCRNLESAAQQRTSCCLVLRVKDWLRLWMVETNSCLQSWKL
jgi:hypothetical protein